MKTFTCGSVVPGCTAAFAAIVSDRHRRRVGLKRGCAVAYTDKGTGSGVHDLATNTVNTQNGVRADATVASANSTSRRS